MIHHTNKHQVHTVPMVIVHTVPMVIAIVDKDVYSYRKTRSGIQSLATVQQETTHRKLRSTPLVALKGAGNSDLHTFLLYKLSLCCGGF